MSNIVNLSEARDLKKRMIEERALDIIASYTCLRQCLKTIEMNNLKELRDLKTMMRKTMKILSRIE